MKHVTCRTWVTLVTITVIGVLSVSTSSLAELPAQSVDVVNGSFQDNTVKNTYKTPSNA